MKKPINYSAQTANYNFLLSRELLNFLKKVKEDTGVPIRYLIIEAIAEKYGLEISIK